MADIAIIKLKVRRGSDAQRKLVVLDQGELGYTIDTKRLFVGTGTLSGGEVVGTKAHSPLTNITSLTAVNAQVGDICYANSALYQLTAATYNDFTSWAYIGLVPDSQTLELDQYNILSIKDNSITSTKLNSNLFGQGLETIGNEIRVKLNSDHLELSGSRVSVKSQGITSREISTTALSSGLIGGNSNPIRVNIDNNTIGYTSSGALTLCAYPSGVVSYGALTTALQLQLDQGLSTADENTLTRDGITGVMSLSPLVSSGSQSVHLATVITDEYGRVVEMATSIIDAFSCLSASSIGNPSLSSMFSGDPEAGGLTILGGSRFDVLSTNRDRSSTVHVTLSAGGFISFPRQQAESTRQIASESLGYKGFAIPIFIY